MARWHTALLVISLLSFYNQHDHYCDKCNRRTLLTFTDTCMWLFQVKINEIQTKQLLHFNQLYIMVHWCLLKRDLVTAYVVTRMLKLRWDILISNGNCIQAVGRGQLVHPTTSSILVLIWATGQWLVVLPPRAGGAAKSLYRSTTWSIPLTTRRGACIPASLAFPT